MSTSEPTEPPILLILLFGGCRSLIDVIISGLDKVMALITGLDKAGSETEVRRLLHRKAVSDGLPGGSCAPSASFAELPFTMDDQGDLITS